MGDSLLQKFAGSKALRMRRLFRSDGRLLLVAMDHAAFMGPAQGLDLTTMRAVVKAGADAVMTTFGTARRAAAEPGLLGQAALVLSLDVHAAESKFVVALEFQQGCSLRLRHSQQIIKRRGRWVGAKPQFAGTKIR